MITPVYTNYLGGHNQVMAFRWKQGAVPVLVIAALVAVFAYLVVAGRTSSWPTATCTVVRSRVVRADGPYGPQGAPMVLYKGEYALQYQVNGRVYVVWTNAGYMDKDASLVESKVSSLPMQCPFEVHYNPKRPAEAVAH